MKIKNIIKLFFIFISIFIFIGFLYIFVNESSIFYKKNYQVGCDKFLTKNELEIWKNNNKNIILELESINGGGIKYDDLECKGKYGLKIIYLSVGEYKNTIKFIGEGKTINRIPYKITK